MKKLLFALVILALAVSCFGQVSEIYYRENATILWEPVTTDNEGNPLLPDDVVAYEVYVYNSALSIDDQDPANLTFVALTPLAEATINFDGMPRYIYYAGIRAVVTDGQGATSYSPIAWTYDPVATDPIQPFAYIPLGGVLILPAPARLRDSGT